MSGSNKDSGKGKIGDQNDELSPEELGKVTGGSIPVKPPQDGDTESAGQFGTGAGTKPAGKPQNDDFIKPF